MANKCKKASHTKNRDLAVANTLRNKIAKLEKRLRQNPNQPVVINALAQAKHDLGRK